MKMRRKGGNPYPDAEPIEVTVKKDGRYWKMSVLYKVFDLPEREDDGKEIGIDLNTYNISYSSSDGERGMYPLPDLTDKEIRIRQGLPLTASFFLILVVLDNFLRNAPIFVLQCCFSCQK